MNSINYYSTWSKLFYPSRQKTSPLSRMIKEAENNLPKSLAGKMKTPATFMKRGLNILGWPFLFSKPQEVEIN